jgi:hypothetical protein
VGKYAAWFLVELEEASSHLSAVHRSQLQDEFSDHIEAAIQARVELGDPPEVADMNAVRALGNPATVARSFEPAAGRVVDPISVVCAVALSVLFCLVTAFADHPLLPFFGSTFVILGGVTLARSTLKTFTTPKTVFWAGAVSLLILSLGLPLARVAPPNDTSVRYAAASLDALSSRVEGALRKSGSVVYYYDTGGIAHYNTNTGSFVYYLNGTKMSVDEANKQVKELGWDSNAGVRTLVTQSDIDTYDKEQAVIQANEGLLNKLEQAKSLSLSARIRQGFTPELPIGEKNAGPSCRTRNFGKKRTDTWAASPTESDVFRFLSGVLKITFTFLPA